MTIDELLNIASKNIGFAMLTNTIDQQERAICAAIAQAAATTAQAMILDAACSKGQTLNNRPAYWLRVDTGA